MGGFAEWFEGSHGRSHSTLSMIAVLAHESFGGANYESIFFGCTS